MEMLLENWLYITSRILPVGLNSFYLFIYIFISKPSEFIPTIAESPNLSSVQEQYKSFLWLH